MSNTNNQTREKRYYRADADIVERENEFQVKLDLPGISKNDIEIKVDKGILSVKAECNKKADEESLFCKHEFAYRGYARAIKLTDGVDLENIQADYTNGTLSVTLHKRAEQKPKKIPVHAG